jgi:hypothetical protein
MGDIGFEYMTLWCQLGVVLRALLGLKTHLGRREAHVSPRWGLKTAVSAASESVVRPSIARCFYFRLQPSVTLSR